MVVKQPNDRDNRDVVVAREIDNSKTLKRRTIIFMIYKKTRWKAHPTNGLLSPSLAAYLTAIPVFVNC